MYNVYDKEHGDEHDDRLHTAVIYNDVAAVQQALRHGANVNSVDRFFGDTTALYRACKKGHTDIARILLDAGANARWCYAFGWSALWNACLSGNLSIVKC